MTMILTKVNVSLHLSPSALSTSWTANHILAGLASRLELSFWVRDISFDFFGHLKYQLILFFYHGC